MKEQQLLCGYGVILRPVEVRDAEFILWQRRLPRAIRYLGDTGDGVVQQRQWISLQHSRNADLYFLCETAGGNSCGTIGVYDIAQNTASWGRFLISPEYNAALQCLTLIFDYSFVHLGLSELTCTVVKSNTKALALYEWVGHRTEKCAAPAALIGGVEVAQVRCRLEKGAWLQRRKTVIRRAESVVLLRAQPSC